MKSRPLLARPHLSSRRLSIILSLFLGIWSIIGCEGVAQTTGELPADRFPAQGWSPITWDDPGGWTTIDVTTRGITPAVADAAPILQELANNAGSPTIFYFPPGTYTFLSQVDIKEDNIILQGAGSDLTRLVIDGSGSHEIRFIGWQEDPISVTANVPANGVTLTLASAGSLSVGDLIEVSQDLPDWEADWGRRSWGQIVKVTAISGNTVTVDMPLSLGLSVASGPSIKKMHPVKNVGVEALAVERKAYGESNNLEFRSVYNAFVRDVESYNAVKYHIQLYRCRQVIIEGNHIHHSQNYGTGGHGYGVNLEQLSTRILVTNNIFENLRHHILVQTGTNHSIISYNYNVDLVQLVDVSLHGHYPNHNLYEGNLFWWGGVADFWGPAGPENTFFRNRIQGKTSGGVGLSIYDRSNRQNVIANHVLRGAGIERDGEIVDTYQEGNIVDGAPVWNTLSSSADLPASLYLDAAPDFWPANLPWPAIGPDVSGSDLNDIPAKMRYEGTLGGGGGDPVNERPSVALTSPSNGMNYTLWSDIRLEASASDIEASLSIESLSPFIAGDASGNGSVSAQDAALVLAHAVGLSLLNGPAAAAADVSGNADLSALDASLILRFVTGLISCFPSEGNCDTVSALPSPLQLPGRAVRTR